MTHPSPEPFPIPAPGPRCGHGAGPATDPPGCRGVPVPGTAACLAHLDEADRDAYLASLAPGADVDHRDTPFTTDLLRRLLGALRASTSASTSASGRPEAGRARFDGAVFGGDAGFDRVVFTRGAHFGGAVFDGDAGFTAAVFTGGADFGDAVFARGARFGGAGFEGGASFDRAAFRGDCDLRATSFTGGATFDRTSFARDADFGGAIFKGHASFGGAAFRDDAWFKDASFKGTADFSGASFDGTARFGGAVFKGDARFGSAAFARDAVFARAAFAHGARFRGAVFTGDARFDGAVLTGSAWFDAARFEGVSRLGPLVCDGTVSLDGAVFAVPATVEAAARRVSCARTRWASTATLHLRYAEVDLRDAVLEYPVLVAARPTPFPRLGPDSPLPETRLSGREPGVRLVSVGGVDAAHLALHDVDLSACRFAGAVHLDQLRVDGWCTFATTPTGWNRRFPWRWSRRNTLAEEHHWRSRTARRPALARGWTAPPPDAPDLRPAAVAALYRQVRKSLEDGKNEPDAADFYYGEMEMRRHDTHRPRSERALLTAYWALSGYGLRAARALVWLLGAMAATLLALLLWGLPAGDPEPVTTGRQVAAGQEVTWTTRTPDPVGPTGPLTERVTAERFEKALRVVINSVAFRSSGQDLTTAGTYTEMASRLAEPVLLGLAVLAVRTRVKR
ncbi:pentapeptide repeat-containing protein [Streptomyces sp. DH37]|uniref:pentapeptide repeat-containing protein n=1 Tax=Streptomyces sp. DH37 TaxID=3040122 RepID=UPI002440F50B|nr:pentapeptide repeat-containing protein [Streptomyces sp. DH37]MDG9705372.1 pentapeptide repeat-containing protein [Streptomyces sp. DH37]